MVSALGKMVTKCFWQNVELAWQALYSAKNYALCRKDQQQCIFLQLPETRLNLTLMIHVRGTWHFLHLFASFCLFHKRSAESAPMKVIKPNPKPHPASSSRGRMFTKMFCALFTGSKTVHLVESHGTQEKWEEKWEQPPQKNLDFEAKNRLNQK